MGTLKVYVSVDMEGITGLVDAEDVQPPGRDYERGRVLMTEDANAAVQGAYHAGASPQTAPQPAASPSDGSRPP